MGKTWLRWERSKPNAGITTAALPVSGHAIDVAGGTSRLGSNDVDVEGLIHEGDGAMKTMEAAIVALMVPATARRFR